MRVSKLKISVKIITATLLCLSGPGYAGPGWTDFSTVEELVPTSRHYYEVRLAVSENPSNCSNERWFYQNYKSPGSDMMYYTLLEGIKSGIKVRVYVTGSCNINSYSEFSSLSIVR